MLYTVPSQSIMRFSYECDGTDATATTYSYLKEPRIAESDYSIGLKSGSFNYLENGNMSIKENIDYFYGNGTNISNSTVNHELEVDFKGERGISEFFGRGFFNNNRWISAWKKIRYESSPTMKVGGWSLVSLPSNYIKVSASAKMDSSINASYYALNYDANIKNGVIETKDAIGWTNRTGSRKIDWEHETRTTGSDIHIVNDLYDAEDIITEIGPGGDWLPCCFKGTIPVIEQLDEIWPSGVMIDTLNADTKYPTKKLTENQIVTTQLANVGLASNQFKIAYVKPSLRIGSITSIPEARIRVAGPSPQSAVLYAKPGLKIGSIASIPNLQVISPEIPSKSKDLYYVKKNLKLGMVTAFPDVQLELSDNSTGNISYKTPPILEDSKPCEDGSCEGYDCIYTYDEESMISTAAGSTRDYLRKGEVRKFNIALYGFEKNSNTTHEFDSTASKAAKEERYKLTVSNVGDVPLRGAQITADIGKGIKFVNSVYDDGAVAKPFSIDPETFKEEVRTTVKWDIGDLQPLEAKTILFKTFLKIDVEDANNTDIKAKVNDSALGNIQIKASVNKAEVLKDTDIKYYDPKTQSPCPKPKEPKERCIPKDSWITQVI